MIQVRAAVDTERDGLIAVWRSAVEATHHFLTAQDVDWYEPHVLSYLRSAADLRVAQLRSASEHPVGFIAVEDYAVQMLFVDASVQGRGVGSALLSSVLASATDSGSSRRVTVDVNEDNASGRTFYRARGFEVVGRSPVDDQGRPFPILHLQKSEASSRREGEGHAAV